jgi:hypothetical protein
MKATYNLSGNFLQEIAEMEKPRKPTPYTDSIDSLSLQRHKADIAEYDRMMAEYTRLFASLRTIPCLEECKSLFKDKNIYEEGGDNRVIPLSVDYDVAIGTKVKAWFIDGRIYGGYDHQKEFAEKYLKPDMVYEIERSDIGGWHTDFYLKEFPGKGFNSAHFIYPEPVAVPLSQPVQEEATIPDLQSEAEAKYPLPDTSYDAQKTDREVMALMQHAYLEGRKITIERIAQLENEVQRLKDEIDLLFKYLPREYQEVITKSLSKIVKQ